MAKRTCTNCGAAEWTRHAWCDDCLRAAYLGAAYATGSTVAAAILGWIVHRLFS